MELYAGAPYESTYLVAPALELAEHAVQKPELAAGLDQVLAVGAVVLLAQPTEKVRVVAHLPQVHQRVLAPAKLLVRVTGFVLGRC